MKRIVPFFILLLSFSLTAQVIDDGGFESKWGTYSLSGGGTYDDYSADDVDDLIKTLNSLIHLNDPISPTKISAFKETNDPHSGNAAIKVVSSYFLGGQFFVPGVFGTITEDYAQDFIDNGSITVYLPYVHKPLALEGYFKYAPIAGDSAVIEVIVYNEDIEIGKGSKKIYGTVSSWEQFRVNVEYSMPDATATDIRMLFIASAGYNFENLNNCKGEDGTALWIDDIAFSYTSGLKENLLEKMKVKVYPNPASEMLKFDLTEDIKGRLALYDMKGSEVYTMAIDGNKAEVNISGFAPGTYFYRFIKGSAIISSGKFIKD